jgi:hypothetical protein
MSEIENRVNCMAVCMYVAVDLIIFIFVFTNLVFIGAFVIIIPLNGVGAIHRCLIGGN